MQLNNFYERALWNEWNQLKKDFQRRTIRQFYYPQYMDTYYQFESKLSVMQRQQISNAKNHYHQLGNLRLTQDQQKIWNEQTKIIEEHHKTISQHNKDGMLKEFFETLDKLNENRLHIMMDLRSAYTEERNRQEAAEALIMMQKQEMANEKRRITNERKKRARDEAKENTPRVRRSARVRSKTSDDPNAKWYRGTFYTNND